MKTTESASRVKTALAFAAGIAAASTVMILTGLGPADEHGHESGHTMSPEEEMAAYMASIMPGEHHAAMSRSVGTWDAKTSFMMEPDAPFVEGTAVMVADWVLGGRYIHSTFHMDDMMGMPFDGISYIGYDNIRQEYVSTWMDTFGTGIMYMTGQINEAGEHRMSGSAASPMGERKMEIVTVWRDDDHFSDTFYDIGQDGSRTVSGRIEYTRR